MARPYARRAVDPAVVADDAYWQEVLDFLAPAERSIRRAFVAAVAEARTGVNADRIADLIKVGDFDRAVSLALGTDGAADPSLFLGLRVAVAEAALTAAASYAAGELVATVLPKTLLDTLAPQVVTAIRTATMSTVQDVSNNTRQAMRFMLEDASVKGLHPYEAGRRMESVIGLTARDAKAMLAYRAELERQSTAPRQRKLVDQRFGVGKPFTPEVIETRVAAYGQRLLRHRGETVGITEAARAFNIGSHTAWADASKRNRVDLAHVRRYWVVARDERTCPICVETARLNPHGVGMYEPFQTPRGPAMLPPLHPRCRCVIRYGFALAAAIHDLYRAEHG